MSGQEAAQFGEYEVVIPDCPVCEKPLGLYYAQCLNCYADADLYSFADYEADHARRITSPETSAQ